MRLPGARLTSVQVDGGRSLAGWRREAQRDGFASRAFLYACDEPDRSSSTWRDCRRNAGAARQRWPGLDVLITSTLRDATRFGAVGLIDILVTLVNEMDDKPGASSYAGDQRPVYDRFLSAPRKELWLYTSCRSHRCAGAASTAPYWAGWPSYAIDQPASEQRAMGFLAYEYRATGELYYAADHALGHAWDHQYAYGGNGDGTLFYPGTPERIGGEHDIPIDSIRLKRIRDGFEDYEYLHLLAERGGRAVAMRIARGLFPTLYETNVPAAAFQAARDRLARLIESSERRRGGAGK